MNKINELVKFLDEEIKMWQDMKKSTPIMTNKSFQAEAKLKEIREIVKKSDRLDSYVCSCGAVFNMPDPPMITRKNIEKFILEFIGEFHQDEHDYDMMAEWLISLGVEVIK